ncbi:hypothetical protein ACFX11_040812 [Malus domestica]
MERQAKEKAFDERLIGPGGTWAQRVKNVVLFCLNKDENDLGGVVGSEKHDVGIDLNFLLVEGVIGSDNEESYNQNVMGDERLGTLKLVPMGGTQDSDPFNMGPIIKAIYRERNVKSGV